MGMEAEIFTETQNTAYIYTVLSFGYRIQKVGCKFSIVHFEHY